MEKNVITFKGSREGLMFLCDEEASWEEILEHLSVKLQGREGVFFDGADVVIDTGSRILSSEQVSTLWELFHNFGVQVKIIKSGMEPHVHGASELLVPKENKSKEKLREVSVLPTLTVRKNIRSGQDITFNGNVIIMGDVKPGAEIIATGFIMVWGDLRGTVHAGASGDLSAWVAALRMQPVQLRIADYITRAPDEEPMAAEIAKIFEGIIVVEKLRDSVIMSSIGGVS